MGDNANKIKLFFCPPVSEFEMSEAKLDSFQVNILLLDPECAPNHSSKRKKSILPHIFFS